MVYVVTLTATELSRIRPRLRAEQRFTKGFAHRDASDSVPNLVLITQEDTDASRKLVWLGVAVHRGTVGAVDSSLTIAHLRECTEDIPLDGDKGLLRLLPEEAREAIERSFRLGAVGSFGRPAWNAVETRLREQHPNLTPVLEWLGALAEAPELSSDNPADQAWQEQRDAVGTIARIFKVPPTTFSAWKRPASPHAPYLAGLIPEPVEHSLIEHDARAVTRDLSLFSEWAENSDARCDIQVFQDDSGRTLEIANVNATHVEARLGTDLIYYYEPTSSFVLVQYKRLEPVKRTMSVNAQLLDQLDRLEAVADLSKPASRPDDWRLGADACFLKLAYWPDRHSSRADLMAPGMYLPLSYVRLLLQDECTLSGRTRGDGTAGRMLGYPQVSRHLINSQFIELVQNGLVGTSGVTVEQVRGLVNERVRDGHSVVTGTERSPETARVRQKRVHDRGSTRRSVKQVGSIGTTTDGQNELMLFPMPPETGNT
ncbi:hypothetical protein ACIO52_25630 [Nocardia sp. NPDC087230]|uniref:hypothetical protein n=1 Tax=Nocardia sp. NPDC087230 TaxID=3364331 RepID=UPI0038300763